MDLFCLVGFLAGLVCYDASHPHFVGAQYDPRTASYAAEASALLWACLWCLQIPIKDRPASIVVGYDNKPVGGIAFKAYSPSCQPKLAKNLACIASALHLDETIGIHHEHVQGHSGHPWNEMADKLCDVAAKGLGSHHLHCSSLLRGISVPEILLTDNVDWAFLATLSGKQAAAYPPGSLSGSFVPDLALVDKELPANMLASKFDKVVKGSDKESPLAELRCVMSSYNAFNCERE